MANEPTYRRSVQVEPISAPNIQGAYEEFSNNLQRFFSGIESGIVAYGSNEYAQKGATEGSEVGAKEPGFSAASLTPFGKIEQQSFDQAQKAVVQNQVFSSAPQIVQSVLSPQNFNRATAIQDFNGQYSAMAEGVLSKTPPSAQMNARNYLSYFYARGAKQVYDHIDAVDKNLSTNSLYTNINNNQDLASEAFQSGNDPAGIAAIDQGHQHVVAALNAGLITGQEAESLNKRMFQEANTFRYLGGLDKAISSGNGMSYIKDFVDQSHPDLNQMDKSKVLTQMLGRFHDWQQAQGINKSSINKQKSDLIANYSLGATQSSQQARESLVEQSIPHGTQEYRDFELQKAYAQNAGQILNSARFANTSEASQLLDALKPSPDESNYSDLYKIWNAIGSQVSSLQRSRDKDPFQYNVTNPGVVNALLSRQTSVMGPSGRVQASGVPQLNSVEANVLAQRQQGVPEKSIRVMSISSATDFVNQLSNLPNDQKLNKIDEFMSYYKTMGTTIYNYAQRDLQTAGLPQSIGLVYSASQNKKSSAYLSQLLDWVGSDPKNVDAQFSIVQSGNTGAKQTLSSDVNNKMSDSFYSALSSIPGDTSKQAASLSYQVASFAKYLTARNPGSTIEDNVNTAYNVLVGNQYNFPTINSKTVMLPAEHDESLFKDAHSALSDEASKSNVMVPPAYKVNYPNTDSETLRKMYINDGIRNSYLLTKDAQTKAILVDSQGVPVYKEDGSSFEFPLNDLKSPMSQISVKIADNRGLISRAIDGIADTFKAFASSGETASVLQALGRAVNPLAPIESAVNTDRENERMMSKKESSKEPSNGN